MYIRTNVYFRVQAYYRSGYFLRIEGTTIYFHNCGDDGKDAIIVLRASASRIETDLDISYGDS